MFILISLFVGVMFFGSMLFGKVPIPFDGLIGVYHPFNQIDWGFVAGVPYKNISVTDVFSQLYPWRELAVDMMRSGQWPLWNQYSFGGYPLLANWQSAPFNPLNILMVLFGNVWGYGLMIALGSVIAVSGAIKFLREKKISWVASLAGAVIFGFAGFMTTYLGYATTSLIMAWLPWMWWSIEKSKTSNKLRYAVLFGLCHFPILTGGFFQPALYALLLSWGYLFFSVKSWRTKLWFLLFGTLGVGLSGIQMLSVIEYLPKTIRVLDNNIFEYHFGLLPWRNLVTFIAPDFFGNPATGNFKGFMQYQETAGFMSVVGIVVIIANWLKKGFRENWFFSLTFVGSILLAFDNPLSALIYQLQIPLISTGYASRWLLVAGASGAMMVAQGLADIDRRKLREAVTLIGVLMLVVAYENRTNDIAMRNMILPMGMLLCSLVLSMIPSKRIVVFGLSMLVVFDMYRFMTKFTPFSPISYRERTGEITDKIRAITKDSPLLIESGPLMPANTWTYGRIRSISGYDPLTPFDYAVWFRALDIGDNKNQVIDGSLAKGKFTRYLNLNNPTSKLLDLTGAKYLLALKYDKIAQIDQKGEVNKGYLKDYKVVEVFDETVLLEKKGAPGRIRLYYKATSETDRVKAMEKTIASGDTADVLILDLATSKNFVSDKQDSAEIVESADNSLTIKTVIKNGAYLYLADRYDDGWKALINGKEAPLLRAFGIYRSVELPSGESMVKFEYKPKGFENGIKLSVISAGLMLLVMALVFKKL